jgi:hypothetical protein
VNCRVCGAHVSGETCSEPKALLGVGCYAVMFNCKCGASLCFTMWLSESEAMQRYFEEKRYQEHRTALADLAEARKSGASYAVIRRLEQREEHLAYAE